MTSVNRMSKKKIFFDGDFFRFSDVVFYADSEYVSISWSWILKFSGILVFRLANGSFPRFFE